MWKRGTTLALVTFTLILTVSCLIAGAGSSPLHAANPTSTVPSTGASKSVVNAVYLTNQSTTQKWEKYFTVDTSQKNLQNTVSYLSGLGTRHSSRPECNTSADYIFTTLESYGYTPLRDYFTVVWQDTPHTTQNIYCVKPSPSPDIVLLACHYDSLRALRVGSVIYGLSNTNCPGAVDDASGVAVLLETARLLANVSLEKTVVFAFLSGEEGNSTAQHWFGSQQLINHGYSLFTASLSNIKRVVYLDTLGETPYGESHGNITVFSTLAVYPQTASLIGAASDLGISIFPKTNTRASSSSDAQSQFCSEWKLQSVLPTVTISQGNWNLTESVRLTDHDTASKVDYTFLENVTRILTASLIREFYTLPPASPSYAHEWMKIASLNLHGISLVERDYFEYLADPNSDVVIVGPELHFSAEELQELIAAGKPLILTGETGVSLLKSLGAQLESIQSNTQHISVSRVDLFYHPVWENVEENANLTIGPGQSTLITSGGNLFTFLGCEGGCWLGFYYGNQSLKYVFYVGRDNPTNLSLQAKRVLSNLVFWSSLKQEHVLYLQPSRIVAGEKIDLIMTIRSALSWETIQTNKVNLTVTQNGKQIYHNSLSASNGY
ncbi:MAG: M28 family metallopeptidase, partial [Candidatus Freyarchaeota archaeon]